MSKVKISFVIPSILKKDLQTRMVQDGYDLKEKSRWIIEAVEQLFEMKTYADLVKINDEMTRFEKRESVVVSRDLKSRLNNAIIHIRKIYPSLEGVQSRILRTAIVQRLLSL